MRYNKSLHKNVKLRWETFSESRLCHFSGFCKWIFLLFFSQVRSLSINWVAGFEVDPFPVSVGTSYQTKPIWQEYRTVSRWYNDFVVLRQHFYSHQSSSLDKDIRKQKEIVTLNWVHVSIYMLKILSSYNSNNEWKELKSTTTSLIIKY